MNVSPLSGNETLEELREHVARLQKEVQWLMSGNLSSKNAREFGGWRVGITDLHALDRSVGMSTDNGGLDPVRFWAGSTDKNTAPWRVHKSGRMVATGVLITSPTGTVGISTEDTGMDDVMLWAGSSNKNFAPWRVYESGKMVATGAYIESQSGYPKVIFDPASNFLKAAQSPDHFVLITPFSNGTPAVVLHDGVITRTLLMYVHPLMNGSVISSYGDLHIGAANINLKLYGSVVYLSDIIFVPSWSHVINQSTGQTLQQALDLAMVNPPYIPPAP